MNISTTPFLYKEPGLKNYFLATGIVDEKRKRNSIDEIQHWTSLYEIHFFLLFRCFIEKPIPELRSIKNDLVNKITELINVASKDSFAFEIKWMIIFTMKSSGLHQYVTSIEWTSWEYYITEMYNRYPSKNFLNSF